MKSISDGDVLRYAASLGRSPAQIFSRSAVQEIECPRCHSLPGLPCGGNSGRSRISNHLERCFERIRIFMAEADRPSLK